MIRDFSLVFLLLISDRRNLHRDSRRDTEQNVPCQGQWKGFDDALVICDVTELLTEGQVTYHQCVILKTLLFKREYELAL